MRLSVDNLRFSYSRTEILKGISIHEAMPGEITALIGPNAAGKSTLLKCIAGLLKAQGGIMLDDRALSDLSRNDVTRRVCYLPQDVPINAVLTVFEAVLLARQHTASWRVGDDDLASVSDVLEELGIHDLSLRYLNELSGGQKRMVSIAQALVRSPQALLLDEPTSSLDLQRQLEVLEVIRRVTCEREMTTIIALHDLNLAARHADNFIVMCGGRVYASGRADLVLTPQMIRDVYGVHTTVRPGEDGVPQITPISSVRSGLALAVNS
jgi:iron complex transport system ATP-binding protein